MAAANANVWCSNLLFAGDPLSEVEREAELALMICHKEPGRHHGLGVTTKAALVRSLRGSTSRFGSLDDARFDEDQKEGQFATHSTIAGMECWYWVGKLMARSLAGEYAAALEASSRAQALTGASPGVLERAEHELHGGLTHAALCDHAVSEDRRMHLDAVVAHQRQLEAWAQHCPENFANRALLLAAEIARLEDRDLDATRLYEAAICSARENGFVHSEALALEIAARYYQARGFDRIAKAYVWDARDCYTHWGADAKVRQLEERFPHLGAEEPRADPTRALGNFVESLDLSAVLRVSQAVAVETDLEKLISVVMRLGVEGAGAERGLLLLPRGEGWQIEAEAETRHDAVQVALHQTRLVQGALPESVLQYVLRTNESVLLEDATLPNPFSDDDYLCRSRARSVLCMPLLKQTRLVGVLYLENTLTVGAFTAARMAVLKLLASDAAISLENAQLYRELQKGEARVRRLIDSNIIGIFIWNNDGRLLDANDAFLRIIGYEREELVSGRVRWNDLLVPGWEPRASRAVEAMRDAKVMEPQVWAYVRKDGRHVQVLAGGAAFDETEGNEGVAFILDLTDFKRAEQALRESDRRYHEVQLRLADANRIASIGELSASIAHEINQPLSGIVTNASVGLRMLTTDPPNVAGASETIRRTLRDGKRAAEVVNRLRALFAKKQIALEPVNLNEAAREVLGLFSQDAQREQVALQTKLCDAPCVVDGDRVQLQQVLLNLLRNALDAMKNPQEGPKEVCVETMCEAGERVVLSVSDSGGGLGTMDPERVFEPFYSTKESGMGIGLSISRSIIESHHGRLWATPNEGRGATFFLYLPCAAGSLGPT